MGESCIPGGSLSGMEAPGSRTGGAGCSAGRSKVDGWYMETGKCPKIREARRRQAPLAIPQRNTARQYDTSGVTYEEYAKRYRALDVDLQDDGAFVPVEGVLHGSQRPIDEGNEHRNGVYVLAVGAALHGARFTAGAAGEQAAPGNAGHVRMGSVACHSRVAGGMWYVLSGPGGYRCPRALMSTFIPCPCITRTRPRPIRSNSNRWRYGPCICVG